MSKNAFERILLSLSENPYKRVIAKSYCAQTINENRILIEQGFIQNHKNTHCWFITGPF